MPVRKRRRSLGQPATEDVNGLIRDAQSGCCGSYANAERVPGILF